MPHISGIEAARWMSGLDPTLPIILFTMMDMGGLEKAAKNAGICAVVSKAQGWDLLKSIETVVAGSHKSIQ